MHAVMCSAAKHDLRTVSLEVEDEKFWLIQWVFETVSAGPGTRIRLEDYRAGDGAPPVPISICAAACRPGLRPVYGRPAGLSMRAFVCTARD